MRPGGAVPQWRVHISAIIDNHMNWASEWAAQIPGRVFTDEASRREVSTDFGRLSERDPAAVVRPGSAQETAAALQVASRHSIPVAVRGTGHSQGGQSLSGQAALDTRGLDRILKVDAERGLIVCQAGVTWRTLVEQVLPLQLSPPVLTNNLDATVGGTLSTAGLGVASWSYGTQADHCLELEVVTGQGEILRCSGREHRALFDAVRAGLGQFGVITEVTLELRRHKPRFRSFYLLYDELTALLHDLDLLMGDGRFHYLESWCQPLPQGFRNLSGQKRMLTQWFFPLHATQEIDETNGADVSVPLAGLKFYKHVHTETGKIEEFFTRLDPLFSLWKIGGFWELAHPWMECIVPWQSAASYTVGILEAIPPSLLQGGHILLWPARRSASAVPLFAVPDGDRLLGVGVLLAVPKPSVGQILPLLDHFSKTAMQIGGKRYLSGWVNFDASQWKSHYGPRWDSISKLKRQYDPQRLLNADFIQGLFP